MAQSHRLERPAPRRREERKEILFAFLAPLRWTRCLATEEKASGIRVSSIYPGEVNTPILDNRPKPIDAVQRQRMLQPEDVAAAVLYVATLPPHVSVPELVITPTVYAYL